MATHAMLTNAQILEIDRRRARVLIPVMIATCIAMFGYLFALPLLDKTLADFVRSTWGRDISGISSVALLIPLLLIFLTPLTITEIRLSHVAVICPSCSAELTQSVVRVLATRCCPKCKNQIVVGRGPRDPRLLNRYVAMKTWRFVARWFYAWPILSIFFIGQHFIDPVASKQSLPLLLLPGLMGTIATGWTCLRMKTLRYFPQLSASVISLVAGATIYWHAA